MQRSIAAGSVLSRLSSCSFTLSLVGLVMLTLFAVSSHAGDLSNIGIENSQGRLLLACDHPNPTVSVSGDGGCICSSTANPEGGCDSCPEGAPDCDVDGTGCYTFTATGTYLEFVTLSWSGGEEGTTYNADKTEMQTRFTTAGEKTITVSAIEDGDVVASDSITVKVYSIDIDLDGSEPIELCAYDYQMTATITPDDVGCTVSWEIVGNSLGAEIDEDGYITPGDETGTITVKGKLTTPEGKECCDTMEIKQRGWKDYEDCDTEVAGEGCVDLGSARVFICVGQDTLGELAGFLGMEESNLSMITGPRFNYTPADDNILVIFEGGRIRQIRTPDALVDIVDMTVDDDVFFTVDFYSPEPYPTPDPGNPPPPGVTPTPYAIVNGSFSSWSFEKPPDPPPEYDQFFVTQNPGDSWEFRQFPDDTWALLKNGEGGAPISEESIEEIPYPNPTPVPGDTRSVIREVVDANPAYGTCLSTRENYEMFSFGERLVEKIEGYDEGPPESGLLTTSYDYYTLEDCSGACPELGQKKSEQRPDGSWQMWEYDSNGRLSATIGPYGDSTLSDYENETGSSRKTEYDYTPVDANDPGGDDRPRTITESVGLYSGGSIEWVVVSKTYYAYYSESGLDVQIEEKTASTPTAAYGMASNVRTVTWLNPDEGSGCGSCGRTDSIQYDDGRKAEYTYEQGTWSYSLPATEPTFVVDAGSYERISITTYGFDGSSQVLVPNKSTRTCTIRDAERHTVGGELYVCTGTGGGGTFERVSWSAYEYDSRDHRIHTYRSNGEEIEASWDGTVAEGYDGNPSTMDYTIDTSGIKTVYSAYNDLGRPTQITKKGTSASPIDGKSIPAQADVVTNYDYDIFGRVRETTHGSLTESISYDSAGRLVSHTSEAGLTTGYAYGVTAGGGRMETITRPGGSQQIRSFRRDGELAETSGNGVINEAFEYGVVTDPADPGEPGYTYRTELIGPAGQRRWQQRTYLDAAGRTDYVEEPSFSGTGNYRKSERWYNGAGQIWAEQGDGTFTRYFEYDELGNLVREGLDVGGNLMLDESSVDRIVDTEVAYEKDASNDWWLVSGKTTYPVNNDPTAVTLTLRKERLTGFDGISLLDGAVAIEQIVEEDDLGKQTIITGYVDRINKRVFIVEDRPGSSDTEDEKVCAINGLLQFRATSTDTVEVRGYDSPGRLVGIQRFDGIDPTAHLTTITYGASDGLPETVTDSIVGTTTLDYYGQTGQLRSTTNALGKTTYRRYTARGEVEWEWGSAVTPVKYEYDEYGELTRMIAFQEDPDTGTWADSDAPDNVPAQLPRTDQGLPIDSVKKRVYDSATGLLTHEWYADPAVGPPGQTAVQYAYNSRNQLSTRTNQRGQTTTYGYWNTGELASRHSNSDNASFTYDRLGRPNIIIDAVGERDFTYSGMRLQKETIQGGDLFEDDIVLYRGYDPYGRDFARHVTQDGNNKYQMTYGYDAVDGRLNAADVWTPGVSQLSFTYSYDGSRIDALTEDITDLLVSRSYYAGEGSLESVAGGIDGNGDGDLLDTPDDTVFGAYTHYYDSLGLKTDVVSEHVGSSGDYFWDLEHNGREELVAASPYSGADPNNPGTLLSPDLDYAYDNNQNRGQMLSDGVPTQYTTNVFNQYTTIGSTSPSYDGDGNLSNDGTWTYTWNSENQLVSAHNASTGDLVEYTYDYKGRMVQRKLTQASVEVSREKYLYDEWRLIITMDWDSVNGDQVISTHYWGLDQSGTLDGAAGVGGLLAGDYVGSSPSTYIFLSDGQGNVTQSVAVSGTPYEAGENEYDPYGNLLSVSGSVSPFGYSSKWLDPQTDLYYFGHRWYSPEIGRWMSRDPIGALGGMNLYTYVRNSPLKYIDPDGLKEYTIPIPTIDTGRIDLYLIWLRLQTEEGQLILDVNPNVPRSACPTIGLDNLRPASGYSGDLIFSWRTRRIGVGTDSWFGLEGDDVHVRLGGKTETTTSFLGIGRAVWDLRVDTTKYVEVDATLQKWFREEPLGGGAAVPCLCVSADIDIDVTPSWGVYKTRLLTAEALVAALVYTAPAAIAGLGAAGETLATWIGEALETFPSGELVPLTTGG